MKVAVIVLICLTVEIAVADAYSAMAVSRAGDSGLLSIVYEAGANADIMVLPSDATDSEDYEENVQALSKTAKKSGLYLVAPVVEKTRCRGKQQPIRSTLVFDREGAVLAVKPKNDLANCTAAATPGPVTFTTDFGVTFGVLMEEDLVLAGDLQGLKHFVVAGSWPSEIPYLNARQFAASWAYARDVTVVCAAGLFAGRAGARARPPAAMAAHLTDHRDETITAPPVMNAGGAQILPSEDLSQYIVKPVELAASARGYRETVCHNSFCCEFELKTRFTSAQEDVSYGLAAFDGIRHYGGAQHIGAQTCAVFARAGMDKRSCSFGSVKNNTNIAFEKLIINANVSNVNSVAYPVILSHHHLSAAQVACVTRCVGNATTVSMTVMDADSLHTFGVFARVFDRDYESTLGHDDNLDIYNYIFSDDVQEFFDYMWIRVRILMFIVSIYILEML